MQTMNFLVPTQKPLRVKAGRPKGSSPRSQASIFLALMEGPKSFGEIVNATKLHRNTVASNLKTLVSIGVLTKHKKGVRTLYKIQHVDQPPDQITSIDQAFDHVTSINQAFEAFFSYLVSKGNLKAKKAKRKASKLLKEVEIKRNRPKEFIRYVIMYAPEIAELLSDQPELINRDLCDILQFAVERYNIKREKAKAYLPTRPTRNLVPKIKETCLPLGSNLNVIDSLLKTFLKSIMETEDVKNLILSGRARYLSLES